jgi:TPR repeat protein
MKILSRPYRPIHRVLRFALACLLFVPMFAFGAEYDRYHPDTHYRRLGFTSYSSGNHYEAVSYLTRAARYADKPSQLALALMYWEGDGVDRDRARAYAWADVAAERGYPDFLAVRERYWSEMTPEEQAEARRIGAEIAAEYGDAVAQKRLNGLLRQGLSRKTGSRAGSSTASLAAAQIDGSARASMLAAMAGTALMNIDQNASPALTAKRQMKLLEQILSDIDTRPSPNYYSDANWRPKQYWAYQDALWNEMIGIVEVRPLKRGPHTLQAE